MEALLTKCKESIKANKQKTTALTEVKESLSKQLADKESELKAAVANHSAEITAVKTELEEVQNDYQILKKKEQEEELQIAESKMVMHQVRNRSMTVSFFKVRLAFKKGNIFHESDLKVRRQIYWKRPI